MLLYQYLYENLLDIIDFNRFMWQMPNERFIYHFKNLLCDYFENSYSLENSDVDIDIFNLLDEIQLLSKYQISNETKYLCNILFNNNLERLKEQRLSRTKDLIVKLENYYVWHKN